MTDHLATDGTPATWAEVRAHDRVIRYRRAGAGAVVVLLLPEGEDPPWPGLAQALAARFRLVVPELPPSGSDVGRWLLDFLEGLGWHAVSLVAAGRCRAPALALARGDGDALARVVLVEEPPSGDAAAGAPSIRLLALPREMPAAEAIRAVTRFLGGGPPSAD